MKLINFSEIKPCRLDVKVDTAFRYLPRLTKNNKKHRAKNCLVYILSGGFHYRFDGGECVVGTGDLLYIPKGASYCYDRFDGTEAMQAEFEIFDAESREDAVLSTLPTVLRDSAFPPISELFAQLIALPPEDGLGMYSYMLLMFSRIANALNGRTSCGESSKIAPALAYLRQNFTAKVKSSQLAELCFLSESQLRRLFAAEVGMSPMEYKSSLTVRRAREMLSSKYLSIGEIAETLGFDSIYAFSHFFKKETGISPKEYRDTAV